MRSQQFRRIGGIGMSEGAPTSRGLRSQHGASEMRHGSKERKKNQGKAGRQTTQIPDERWLVPTWLTGGDHQGGSGLGGRASKYLVVA